MKTNPSLNRSLTTLLCAATASLLILSQPAQAGYMVTLQQVGSNVVATGSGAINLTGLTFSGTGGFDAEINGSTAFIITGNGASLNVYTGFTGPTSFGSGSGVLASIFSGDGVGIAESAGEIFVPFGYVSGAALSDSSTYNNATLSSLGVTPGIYEWTWGTGANQNFTLDAVAPAVPDSGSTFGLLLVALGGLFGVSHFRRALRPPLT
jgi:hypothetical protein